MISIKNKSDCCGCNACGDICPKRAISFSVDEEGFLYPKVDIGNCIDCGLCEKACPMRHVEELKTENKSMPDCYGAEHKSIEVVFSSTSGGMFSAFAEVMYRQGGYVGGAVHNDDLSASQFLSHDRSDLARLRRSKDLQSDAQGFYKHVKDVLQSGEKVLVCGVPRQMAGLRSFLGRDYPNLIIVDLICLGVNSPKVWKKYIKYIEQKFGSTVVWTENKSKEYGWRNLTQRFVLADGREAFDLREESPFIKGYVGTHLYCRPSCYSCRFKGFPRIADITIGDFWGIEKYNKAIDKNLGTSVVLINSDKGAEYFEQAKKRIDCFKAPLETVVSGNPALIHSLSVLSEERDAFFADLDSMAFDEVVEKYSKGVDQGWKAKIKRFLRPARRHLGLLRRIIRITRLHPKALYQTVRYSGLRNLWNGRGILCGTHCTLNISRKSKLHFGGLLILGFKDRFPASDLETRLLVAAGASLTVHGDMTIAYGSDIEVLENGNLIIHGKKYLPSDTNIGCTIVCGNRIELMHDVSIGRNVLIRDNNGRHYMNTSGYRDSRPVIIGEKAWLCESCTIMPGVKIGRGAIVGAKAVVTRSVPDHALVSGHPAEVVGENVLWKR